MRLFRGGLSYPPIALRPVITAARDEPRPIAVTPDAETETIMLDFVEPLWTRRDLAIGQAQAGTTPFSPMSARRKAPTLPRRAAGVRVLAVVSDDGTYVSAVMEVYPNNR
jgi:hypothetical protein